MDEQPLPIDIQPWRVKIGDRVVAQTIWGDEEGLVVDVFDGLAWIDLERGDRIYISPSRVKAVTS